MVEKLESSPLAENANRVQAGYLKKSASSSNLAAALANSPPATPLLAPQQGESAGQSGNGDKAK